MHIGLNLIYLVPGDSGGTETYARELIPELVAAAPEARFTAFVNEEAWGAGGPWESLAPVRVRVHARWRSQWVAGEQALLPPLAARARVDLVHSLANTGPFWGPFQQVLTVQDLHFRLVPEAHLGLNAYAMRLLVPLAARRADRIIVTSDSTRRDLEQLLAITSSKVDVVPLGHGVTPVAVHTPEPELRAWLGADDRPIVLSVSAKRPHKNLIRLIEAVATIAPERRPLLVIPGYTTRYEQDLLERAAALGVEEHVRLLGWIDAARLEGLYAAARCVVCPSLHEGFGLPVLEAMARGVPVASSDRGALAEVAGDAAILFDPESVPQITAAIERLLVDPAEPERLRKAGLERAARFTWAATAAGTLATYARVLGH